MTINGIFSNTIAMLEKSLNLRSLQHRVLASNIANMDTPNYKAVELEVKQEMNRNQSTATGLQLKRTQPAHLPIHHYSSHNVKFKVAKPPEFSLRGDGNTVDLDRTMGKMAKNTLLYRTATQLISNKFSGLKKAIKGGSS